MRPDDLAQLRVPGTPTLCDGLLLVDVARPDIAQDRHLGGLWKIPVDGAPAQQWTFGEADSMPRISPDGAWVVFRRSTGTTGRAAAPQLYLMATGGGEPKQLTDLPLGVGEPVWSPDSQRIACTARIPAEGRYGTADGVGPDAEPPRRITSLSYRLDDVGFTGDRHPRLHVLDPFADEPAPVALTDGSVEVSDPAWTPDGARLIFVADRDFGATDTVLQDIYAVPASGGEPALLVRTEGGAALPTVTADGLVLYLGAAYAGVDMAGRNVGLWAAPAPVDGGPAAPRRLTDTETVCCEPGSGRPVATGRGILVGVRHRGDVELRLVPVGPEPAALGACPVVSGGPGIVRGFAVSGELIAISRSTMDSPGEVLVSEGGVSGETPLVQTAFAEPLRAHGIRPVEELIGSAPDGHPVHGFLVRPEGAGPHPVLLHVHGGPFMFHTAGFFDEAQVYAAAGYAVVLPNPRGSAGYGEAHGRAIVHALGTVDVDDVLAVLDLALARPECDSERVGVMGGSYGGFMTSWLAAHHGERFQAAWSERAVNAWDSFAGSSDIGWFFAEAYCGPDPAQWRARSPLTYAEQIRIPFCVAHSEQDWRCPVEQAQRLFVALRRAGVDSELILFPGEGHELSRTGRPKHRVQRFQLVLDWWDRHLGAGVAKAPGSTATGSIATG